MKLSKKAKKALVTLRKEFGFTLSDIFTFLGNTVSLDEIKDFENDTANEDEYLTGFYLDLFSVVFCYRFQLKMEDEIFNYELSNICRANEDLISSRKR